MTRLILLGMGLVSLQVSADSLNVIPETITGTAIARTISKFITKNGCIDRMGMAQREAASRAPQAFQEALARFDAQCKAIGGIPSGGVQGGVVDYARNFKTCIQDGIGQPVYPIDENGLVMPPEVIGNQRGTRFCTKILSESFCTFTPTWWGGDTWRLNPEGVSCNLKPVQEGSGSGGGGTTSQDP